MSLASLTVDLTLGLARFESDSGKASQIIARDTEKMDRATRTFVNSLQRMQDQASKSNAELATIKAAALGLGDGVFQLISAVHGSGLAFADAGKAGTSAFGAIGAAAATTGAQTSALLTTLKTQLLEVTSQANALRADATTRNQAGTLTDDGLKVERQRIAAVEAAERQRVIAAYEADKAVIKQAADEAAASAVRVAAAQKIVDAQNGLTATYRTQLAVLRELRDAGALTPGQFGQAKSQLVASQPGSVSAAGALSSAQAGASSATAAAQAQVYAAFLLAQAAAADQVAQAEAREAEVNKQVAAASDRARAAQQAQYETKTAFIARINEEAAALFRTKDAQVALDAQRAGVSAQQAAQLAKFSGDRSFLASIYEQIGAEQKKADQFGKSATEILKQEAALRGLSNTAAGAIARFDALAVANKNALDAAAQARSNNAFAAQINERANAIKADGSGLKLQSELLAEQAAARGLTETLAPAIQKIREFENATGNAGKGAFATRNQLLTLKYTLSDVIASAASGISPLTILLQQGGQVAQIEGGIGGVFKTVLSLITPFRLAVAGVSTAVGALAYSFYEGSKQSKAFADSLVLTGNFAGITEGQFNDLAKTVAASGLVTVGAARETAQALISTGQVGPQVLAKATQAAALYGKATNQNAAEVAKDFAAMGDDAAKWAADHNKSLNFITYAQYDQIKSLQELGKTAEAQGVVYEALADRFKHVDDSLGYLGRALQTGKNLWSQFWDAAFDVGRTETLEDKIAKAASAAAAIRARLEKGRAANPAFSSAPALRPQDQTDEQGRLANRLASVNGEEAALEGDQGLIQQATAEKARQEQLSKLTIAFESTKDAYLNAAKAGSEKKKALDALNAYFSNRQEAGKPVDPQEQADLLKGLNKRFEDRRGANDANAERKAQLDKALKAFQDNLAHQQDALKFSQTVIDAEYAASNVSLEDYYTARQKITAAGVKEELDTLTASATRIQAELSKGGFKNAAERTKLETELQQTIEKRANVERDADRAATKSKLDLIAAQKQLNNEVAGFQANLRQQQGDDAGAAALRLGQSLQAAKDLATKSGGLISRKDLDDLRAAGEAANALADIQKRTGFATADATRAEEAYGLIASKTGASLAEQDAAVFAIRAKLAEQLKDTANKTQALADANQGNAEYQQKAADAALAYAKALDTVDPALTRLKSAGDEVATSLSGIFGDAVLKATNFKDFMASIGNSLKSTFVKTFFTQPLEADLKGVFNKFIDSDNPLAKALKSAVGASAKTDPALAAQTAAVNASTSALNLLVQAASDAAAAVGGAKFGGPSTELTTAQYAASGFATGSDSNYGHEAMRAADQSTESAQKLAIGLDAAKYNTDQLAASLPVAGSLLERLGGSAGVAGQALSILPSVIRLIEGAAGGSSSGGGWGQIIGAIAGYFTGGTTSGGGSGYYVSGATGSASTVGMSLAVGTNYVPRDGLVATLHEGEAVVPKAYNPAAGGAMVTPMRTGASGWGGGNNVTVNVKNEAGDVVQASASKSSNGEIEVLVRKIVRDENGRDLSRGAGPISDGLKARGLKLDAGNPRRN